MEQERVLIDIPTCPKCGSARLWTQRSEATRDADGAVVRSERKTVCRQCACHFVVEASVRSERESENPNLGWTL